MAKKLPTWFEQHSIRSKRLQFLVTMNSVARYEASYGYDLKSRIGHFGSHMYMRTKMRSLIDVDALL